MHYAVVVAVVDGLSYLYKQFLHLLLRQLVKELICVLPQIHVLLLGYYVEVFLVDEDVDELHNIGVIKSLEELEFTEDLPLLLSVRYFVARNALDGHDDVQVAVDSKEYFGEASVTHDLSEVVFVADAVGPVEVWLQCDRQLVAVALVHEPETFAAILDCLLLHVSALNILK